MVALPFRDREEAARQLLGALQGFRDERPLVLAIPRGAVHMGRIIAEGLGGELDVVLVRKIGAPGNPELAIGAVDEQGTVVLNENAAWLGTDNAYVQHEARRQLALIRERRERYRHGKPALAVKDRCVIVVDDGLATGATMSAALKATRAQNPSRLICAVPVAAHESLAEVAELADEVVCLATPSPFFAVGQFYSHFSSVSDAEVAQVLAAPVVGANPGHSGPLAVEERAVRITAGSVVLEGDLRSPPSPRGLVIFAHGSGSSRHSVRNRQVASALQQRGFSTLLFDLLTEQEDRDPQARFDIPLLAQRLDAALSWARGETSQRDRPMGLFGASTGAAAAIMLAASRPQQVAAVVSRGGRPDLAGAQALSQVRTPILLVVGGDDVEVLQLNRNAQAAMRGWAELLVVPGATHLFEEPGTLDRAAEAAGDWFLRWL
ncbi:MAG TPA: alpha/beta fold hydrolase [Lysobacter sp.]|nr:alpha/beta fold hydrolase [Lysobacter sp.]